MMAGIPLVVPFGREGASDRAARVFAAALARSGGDALAIENLSGGGGLDGVLRANALAAGGAPVLLLATPSTHVLLPARRGRQHAPAGSFRPMVGLGSAPNVLLASPRLGVRSCEELVRLARERHLTYASAGTGQTIHVCTALFCEQAAISMTHRPYEKGSALAYGDLAAGEVHVYFDNLLGCRDRIEAGDAVPLAVSSAERSAGLPQVPTLAECGFEGHALDVWMGIFGANLAEAPAKHIGALDADQAFGKRLAEMGLAGGPLSSQAFSLQVEGSAPDWLRALEAAEHG